MKKDLYIDNYCKIIREKMKSTVLIYGAGHVGKIVLKICNSYGIRVDGFCVTSLQKNKSNVCGLPVYEFGKLLFDPKETLLLVAIKERGESKIIPFLNENWEGEYIKTPEKILEYDEWDDERRKRPGMHVTTKVGCIIQCKYCPQQLFLERYYLEDKRRTSQMSFSDYQKCLEKLPKDTVIEWGGFVEPFLNPECIDMMEYTHKRGYDMILFTTLVGLDKERFSRIRKLPFRRVILHTPDKDNFAKIPMTKEFLKLFETVINAKKDDGKQFVDGANCQSEPHPDILKLTKGKLKIHCELLDRGGVLKSDGEQQLASANRKGPIYCDQAENVDHNTLLPDGSVVLCCNDFGMRHVLGNLLYQDYDEIMHGEEMKRVKYGMRKDDTLPILCRNCVVALNDGE